MKTAIRSLFKNRVFHSRFFVLFLACLSGFSMFYCSDIPSLIKAEIVSMMEKQAPGKSEYYFNLMYSLYCFPNIILPILSGLLIDKMGYNALNIVFCGLIFLGNFIVYLGFRIESISLLLFGRFVYGLGGESYGIGISALLVSWFRGKELAFSQAISLSVGRLGSVLNCFLSPHLIQNGLSAPYGMATVVCLVSLVSICFLSMIDSTAGLEEIAQNREDTNNQKGSSLKEILADLAQCKAIFWIHVAAMTLFYLAYLPFNMVASGYFLEKWYAGSTLPIESKLESVGHYLSIPLIISSIFFPIFGLMVDKIGHRIHLLIISALLMISAYVMFLNFSPLVPLLLLGFAYGIFGTVVWAMVVFLVPQRVFGTAMGLINLIQNASMTLFPIFLAYLEATSESNRPGMVTLLACSILAILSVIGISHSDKKNKISLNSTDQKGLTELVEEEYAPKQFLPLKNRGDEEDEKARLL